MLAGADLLNDNPEICNLDEFYIENQHMGYHERLSWYISTWTFAHRTIIRAGKKMCLSMTLFNWLCNKVVEYDTDTLTIEDRLPQGFHERYNHETYTRVVSIKDSPLSITLDLLRGIEWMLYSSIRPIEDETLRSLFDMMIRLFRHLAYFLKGHHPASTFDVEMDLLGGKDYRVEYVPDPKEEEEEEEEDQDEDWEVMEIEGKEEKTEQEIIEENMRLLWINPDEVDSLEGNEEYDDELEPKEEEQKKVPEKLYESNWKFLFLLDTKFGFFFNCHHQYYRTRRELSIVIPDRKKYVERIVNRVGRGSEEDLVVYRHEFMLKRIVPYSQIRLYNYFMPFTEDDLDEIPIRDPLLWEERSDVAMDEITFQTYEAMWATTDEHEIILTIDSFLSYYSKNSMERDVVDILCRKSCFVSMIEFPYLAIEYASNRYVLYMSRTEFYCFDSLLDAFCYMIFSLDMIIFQIGDAYTLNLTQLKTCLSTDVTNSDFDDTKKKKRRIGGKNVTTL